MNNPIIDTLKSLSSRQEAENYLAEQSTADIRAAYTAWLNGHHKPPSRKFAVSRLVEITGTIADAAAIRSL